MDVLQAIEQTEQELATTLSELADARALIAALEQDSKRIKLELTGLKSYANRQGLGEVAAPSGNIVPISGDIDMLDTGTGPDLSLMSRSDAVATALGSADGPLDRAAIHELIIDGGRFDSIDDISLTLSGLKRSGRVEKLGHGLWQLSTEAATG